MGPHEKGQHETEKRHEVGWQRRCPAERGQHVAADDDHHGQQEQSKFRASSGQGEQVRSRGQRSPPTQTGRSHRARDLAPGRTVTTVAWRPGLIKERAVKLQANAPLRHVDVPLVFGSVAIAAYGVVMVYASTRTKLAAAGAAPQMYLDRQLLWVGLGLGIMALMMLLDYRRLLDAAPVVYVPAVLALIFVLSPLGSSARGAQRWFNVGPLQLQPSALASGALVVALAAYCHVRRDDLDVVGVGVCVCLAGVPMALVAVQPDLGSAIVLGSILLTVLLVRWGQPEASRRPRPCHRHASSCWSAISESSSPTSEVASPPFSTRRATTMPPTTTSNSRRSPSARVASPARACSRAARQTWPSFPSSRPTSSSPPSASSWGS